MITIYFILYAINFGWMMWLKNDIIKKLSFQFSNAEYIVFSFVMSIILFGVIGAIQALRRTIISYAHQPATRRIIIRYDEYLNYEITVQYFRWWWRFETQYRRSTKFSACRLAIAIGKGLKCNVIDKAK